MNRFFEMFMERPKNQKIGFWIGSLVFVIFVYWQYFYSPATHELEQLQEKRDQLSAEISHEQRLAANLGNFRRQIKDLQAKLDVALKQLPPQREIPGLLSSISSLAKDAGLQVRRFATRPDVVMDFYAAVPTDVEVVGDFHQIATFFDEVAGLSRIVNVSDVTIKNPKGVEEEANATVEGSCSVTTFRYLDESERVKKEETSSDQSGKRRKPSTKKAGGGGGDE